MDPALLQRLPDSAKLAILRHLGDSPATSTSVAPAPAPAPGVAEPALYAEQPPAPSGLAGRALEGGVAVLDGFVDAATIQACRQEAEALMATQQARGAGMGGGLAPSKWRDAAFRGDRTLFLHSDRLRKEQGLAALPALLDRLVAELRPWLAAQGLDVGGRPSAQLGHYPGGGARYVRHADWHPLTAPHRTATALLYLTPGWRPAEHGGELAIYTHRGPAGPASALGTGAAALTSGLDQGLPAMVVPPLPGRLVVFDSRLVHEVLPAHAERYAIALWFSRGQAGDSGDGTASAVPAGLPPAVAAAVAEDAAGPGPVAQLQLRPDVADGEAAGQLAAQLQAASLGQPAAAAAGAAAAAHTPAAAGNASWSQGAAQAAAAQPAALEISRPGHIFVSVASYRDSETQWTLGDLFGKAACPDLLRVGVVWQLDLGEEDAAAVASLLPGTGACASAASTSANGGGNGGGSDKGAAAQQGAARQPQLARWRRQVRHVVLDASEATGPSKARALAAQLWDGEEFVLQVDSHMRFAPGWDASLRRQLRQAEAAAGHPRVVLSAYPPGYQGLGPDAALPPDPLPTLLCASHFDAVDGLLRLRARKLAARPAAPVPSLFWAAGLRFGRAAWLLQAAPYRRDLPWLFFAEEQLQLLALRSAGWRIFAPCEVVAFHLWSRAHRPVSSQEPQGSRGGRRAEVEAARARSQAAVLALLQGPQGAALEAECGVDFRARSISAAALAGGMPEAALL